MYGQSIMWLQRQLYYGRYDRSSAFKLNACFIAYKRNHRDIIDVPSLKKFPQRLNVMRWINSQGYPPCIANLTFSAYLFVTWYNVGFISSSATVNQSPILFFRSFFFFMEIHQQINQIQIDNSRITLFSFFSWRGRNSAHNDDEKQRNIYSD